MGVDKDAKIYVRRRLSFYEIVIELDLCIGQKILTR